jgi:hypothetical protein
MSIRSVAGVLGLIALGAAPIAAQANGSAKAVDACVQAFVDNYLPKDQPVQVHKLSQSPGPLSLYTRHFTVSLTAHVSTNGTQLATARCVANSKGQVLELEAKTASVEIAAAQVPSVLK